MLQVKIENRVSVLVNLGFRDGLGPLAVRVSGHEAGVIDEGAEFMPFDLPLNPDSIVPLAGHQPTGSQVSELTGLRQDLSRQTAP
jgi:hypothetical protein